MSIRSPFKTTALLLLALVSTHTLAASEIVLGHISSPTHPSSADVSKQLRAGIQLAIDTANASGGVNGSTVRLEMKDDSLDPKKMADLAAELVADPKVIGLVGNLNTGGLTELSKNDFYGKNGIALVAPYQGNAAVVDARNVYPFRSGYSDELLTILKEAKSTYKKNVAIVYYDIAFGPPMAKFTQDQAAKFSLSVVANAELAAKPNSDLPGSITKAIDAIKRTKPDAIILLAPGKFAADFIGALRKSDVGSAQVYAMSVIVTDALVTAVGEKAARGIVLSQATPYPYSATSKLVADYHRALKAKEPNQQPSFIHLEGYVAGKIALEALRKAGRNLTRQSYVNALNNLGRFDLGGPTIHYTSDKRSGWGGTELVIVGRDGKLIR